MPAHSGDLTTDRGGRLRLGFMIVETLLDVGPDGLSASDIRTALDADCSKRTIHRTLLTLFELGWAEPVSFEDHRWRWKAGPALRRLARRRYGDVD